MAARGRRTAVRESKNRITLAQLQIACRHVAELTRAGVSKNLAIRTLELFADVYAKMLMGGAASPHHVNEVPRTQWSLKALRALKAAPSPRYGDYLRVEHGTPRRAFACMVLDLYHQGRLTQRALNSLTRRYWVLAVITVDEDNALNKIARSKAYPSPAERYRAAGIKFLGRRAVNRLQA